MNLFFRKLPFLCIIFVVYQCGSYSLHAQDQNVSDSLNLIYHSGNYSKAEELNLLKWLAQYETDADNIHTYSLLLITKAKEVDSLVYEFEGYLRQGEAYRLKSELTKALESFSYAAKIASANNLTKEEASVNITIADTYSIMGNSPIAVTYYKKAIALLDAEEDALILASAQLNLGDEYLNQKMLDSTLYYFNASGKIFRSQDYKIGEAYNLGNIGLVYAEMDQPLQAEVNLDSAINILTKLGDYYPICIYLNAMSDIYDAKNDREKSFTYVLESLKLAKKYKIKAQISDANLKLSALHEKYGNPQKALDHFKIYLEYRDQVTNIKDVQKRANIRTEYEVSKKQIEVDLLNQEKKIQRYIVIGIGITLLFIGILAYSLFRRNQFMRKTNAIIASEKKRSDDLLKNILPAETAKELKEYGAVKAKKFEQVTVLFTDFESFTVQAENLDPEFLVKSIDYYFSKFDEIIEEYGLEKIKTIGDSYMCAGGLPFLTKDHAVRTCQAALDILEFVIKTKRSRRHQLAKFDIRIGIHSGPVVAGVVGTKKFQYDIWGDTVNTANRMESSCEKGRVNISEPTYIQVQGDDVFEFMPRGTIDVKGKGKVAMYYIDYAR